jgi:hypothetical protein
MNDIKKAMQAEQSYLRDRLSGKNVSLNLSEYGYEDLETYFSDKRDYQLKNCGIEVHETNMDDIESRVENAIMSKTPSIWIPTADEVFVWHGNEPIDEELCTDLGVHIYNMNYIGGTIVSGPEDLSFAVIIPETIDIGTSYMLEKIKDIMSKYIDDVVIDGNDILIGGMKVLGSMNRRMNGIYVFACQISYADRTEYIKQICSKQSVKIPIFIDGTLLPKEILKDEVIACLH